MTRQPEPPESRGMPKLPPNDGKPEESVFCRSPTQGQAVEPKPRGPHDFMAFNALLDSLQEWRSADHEDNIVLCRSYVIEIIEGVKALRQGR